MVISLPARGDGDSEVKSVSFVLLGVAMELWRKLFQLPEAESWVCLFHGNGS